MKWNIFFLTSMILSFCYIYAATDSIIDAIDSYNDDTYSTNITKRILVVVDRFPWFTKRIITHQITKMIEAGFHVSIYSINRPDIYVDEASVIDYDLLEKIYYENLPPDLDTYDIILCQYGELGRDFIKIKERYNLKAKILTCFRGSDITATERITESYYKDLFKKGDYFLPVCAYYKYRLELLGCDPEKIVVLYSGVDTDLFKKGERGNSHSPIMRLISVCRLHEQKGIQYVLQAIALLPKEFQNIEYIIVGDGSYAPTLKDLTKKLKLSDRVHFVGWKNQKEIASLLHKADVFVLPSITRPDGTQEGIPNALKEAMVTGLPVIATHHSGNYEIIQHGITGFLVPERDANSLKNIIRLLVNKTKLWRDMGLRARDSIIKKFDMHLVNEKLINILKILINNNRLNVHNGDVCEII